LGEGQEKLSRVSNLSIYLCMSLSACLSNLPIGLLTRNRTLVAFSGFVVVLVVVTRGSEDECSKGQCGVLHVSETSYA
jgi:hypothetical protein